MKQTLILLPALFITILSYSQSWFSNHQQGVKLTGYVLGMSGDTLHGYIKYDYPVVMQKRISFFERQDQDRGTTYGPEEIWGYSLSGKTWVSTAVRIETYDGPYSFSRFGILESGYGPLMLLRLFDEEDKLKKRVNSEEAEKITKDFSLSFPPNSLDYLYLKKIENEAIPLQSKAFKRTFSSQMKAYIGDCETLMQKIETKEYALGDIYRIVEEYNTWFESKQ